MVLSSGYEDCKYHMVAKSPVVQPNKHREVLMADRVQVTLDAQKLLSTFALGVWGFSQHLGVLFAGDTLWR